MHITDSAYSGVKQRFFRVLAEHDEQGVKEASALYINDLMDKAYRKYRETSVSVFKANQEIMIPQSLHESNLALWLANYDQLEDMSEEIAFKEVVDWLKTVEL